MQQSQFYKSLLILYVMIIIIIILLMTVLIEFSDWTTMTVLWKWSCQQLNVIFWRGNWARQVRRPSLFLCHAARLVYSEFEMVLVWPISRQQPWQPASQCNIVIKEGGVLFWVSDRTAFSSLPRHSLGQSETHEVFGAADYRTIESWNHYEICKAWSGLSWV